MKLTVGRVAILLSMGLLCTVRVAGAQSSANARVNLGAKVSEVSYISRYFDGELAKDPRLKTHITIRRKSAMISDALSALTTLTHVRLTCQDWPASLAFQYHDVPLRDVMASIAEMLHWRWRRMDDGTLLLYGQRSEDSQNFYRPHTEAEAELGRNGREFLQSLQSLPKEMQVALTSGPAPKLTALPETMQQNIRAMLDAHYKDSEKGAPSNFQPGQEANIIVQLQNHTPVDNHTGYYINASSLVKFTTPGGLRGTTYSTVGLDFDVSDDPNEDYHIVPKSELGGAYRRMMHETAQAREKAEQDDVRLLRRVTFRGEGITFADAIARLASAVDLPYTFRVDMVPDAKRTFAFEKLPLKEVLKRLCALYSKAEPDNPAPLNWSETGGGVLLFYREPREPGTPNPAKIAAPR